MYHVYNTTTGVLISVGAVMVNELPLGLEYKEFPDDYHVGKVWNTTTKDYEAVSSPRIITKAMFVNRFTDAEQLAIANDSNFSGFMTLLGFHESVNLDSAIIISALDQICQSGHISQQRVVEICS